MTWALGSWEGMGGADRVIYASQMSVYIETTSTTLREIPAQMSVTAPDPPALVSDTQRTNLAYAKTPTQQLHLMQQAGCLYAMTGVATSVVTSRLETKTVRRKGSPI